AGALRERHHPRPAGARDPHDHERYAQSAGRRLVHGHARDHGAAPAGSGGHGLHRRRRDRPPRKSQHQLRGRLAAAEGAAARVGRRQRHREPLEAVRRHHAPGEASLPRARGLHHLARIRRWSRLARPHGPVRRGPRRGDHHACGIPLRSGERGDGPGVLSSGAERGDGPRRHRLGSPRGARRARDRHAHHRRAGGGPRLRPGRVLDPLSGPAPAARRRWLMWGIPAFLFLLAFIHRVAPGVIAKDLMQAFGATGTLVGLLSATYFYSYSGFMLPGGLLIDALGARRVVAAGSAVMGLGTLAMAAAETSAMLFAGRFVIGAGATVTFIGAMKLGAAWFPPERFGTISALTATVGVLGSLIANAPLAMLVAWVGWRGAFWILGAATLAGAALCLAVVRDAPEGTPGVAEPAPR